MRSVAEKSWNEDSTKSLEALEKAEAKIPAAAFHLRHRPWLHNALGTTWSLWAKGNHQRPVLRCSVDINGTTDPCLSFSFSFLWLLHGLHVILCIFCSFCEAPHVFFLCKSPMYLKGHCSLILKRHSLLSCKMCCFLHNKHLIWKLGYYIRSTNVPKLNCPHFSHVPTI